VNLKLKFYLSFQNKIEYFQRDIRVLSERFCHFPNVRMMMNAFREEAITDHKVEEYKNTLQGTRSSKLDLTIHRNKTHALRSL